MNRLYHLVLKEWRSIRRNRQLMASLVIPPTLQIVLFGFALNPQVSGLRLGIVNESLTPESRGLSEAFAVSLTFKVVRQYLSGQAASTALAAGELDAVMLIPANFSRRTTARPLQVLVDGSNAYVAMRARQAAEEVARAHYSTGDSGVRVAYLFNPGLETSWFILTGTIGILLVLNGSIVGASALILEKEKGTIEQLLMLPVHSAEILLAKMAPLFLLLTVDAGLAVAVARAVFGLPFRGSSWVLLVALCGCVLCGIGTGMLVAVFTHTQLQAQLVGFFVNAPLALISGAQTPLEAIPQWLQPLSVVNPVRHFAEVARSVLLKGGGWADCYGSVFALFIIAAVLVGIGSARFRLL